MPVMPSDLSVLASIVQFVCVSSDMRNVDGGILVVSYLNVMDCHSRAFMTIQWLIHLPGIEERKGAITKTVNGGLIMGELQVMVCDWLITECTPKVSRDNATLRCFSLFHDCFTRQNAIIRQNTPPDFETIEKS